MIEEQLFGDQMNGSLLIKILRANIDDVKKGIIDPKTLLGYEEFEFNVIESGVISDFLESAPNESTSDKILQYLVEAAYKMMNDTATAFEGNNDMNELRNKCFSVPPQFYIKKVDQCINLALSRE